MITLVATGCSSGLGLLSLQSLLSTSSQPYHLILSTRTLPTPNSPTEQLATLSASPGTIRHKVDWIQLELNRLENVKEFVLQVKEKLAAEEGEEEGRIDLLFLNAGVVKWDLVPGEEGWSEEAVVNHFAQHLIVQLLSPLFAKPPTGESTKLPPRLVITTSATQNSVKNLDDVTPLLQGKIPAGAMTRYGASKFLQMLSAVYWRRELREQGVDVVVVSPGFVPTTSLSRESPLLARWAMRYIASWFPMSTSEKDGSLAILSALAPSLVVQDLIIASREEGSPILYLGPNESIRTPNSLLLSPSILSSHPEWLPSLSSSSSI